LAGGTLQTVDQALALLEHLAGAREPQALTRLSREFGTAKATTHRLLTTLKARGYVIQDPITSRYGFGSSCIRLAEQARVGMTTTASCRPALRRLWEATEETSILAVFQAGRSVIVDALDSTRPVVVTSDLGRADPLHAVSTGKVLLASRSDDEIRTIIAQGLTRYTAGTCTSPERLRQEIERIRRDGYAVNREGYRLGVCGVAAPVRWARSGPVVAAMGACVPASRFESNVEFLRDAVLTAAREASDALEAAFELADGPDGRRTGR
jgi:DNA-binding IclR family transcriptional regulator